MKVIIAYVDCKFNLFGVFILEFVTVVGDRTLRDLLTGNSPVTYLALPFLTNLQKGPFVFEAILIGIFTITGLEKALM